MSKKNEKQKENSLSIITGGLFEKVDFLALNDIIEKIGTSGKVSEEDKQPAVKAITTWETSVIQRISNKVSELNDFPNKFTVDYYQKEDMDMYEAVANGAGLLDLFLALKDADDALDNITGEKPDEIYEDVSKTLEDQLLERSDYQKEKTLHDIKRRKALKTANTAWITFRKAVMKNEKVKDSIKEIKEYTKKLTLFKTDCIDKAALAKLNVSISDDQLRESLKELLKFGLTI